MNHLIQEKIQQAIHILKEFSIDCWITFVRESGINGDPILPFLVNDALTWHSALIIHKDGTTHAIVGKYDQPTVEELGVYDNVIGYVEGIKRHLQTHLKAKNPQKIALNFSKNSEICDGLTTGMYLTLVEFLSEIGMQDRIISAQKVVSALRERKSSEELRRIKIAVQHTEDIWQEVAEFMKAGMTEKEVAAFVHARIKARGLEVGWDKNVCPAVFSGIGTAEAHYSPTDKKIQKGEIVNMDFGVKYQDYVSDTQRIFYILNDNETEPPTEIQRCVEVVVDSIEQSKQAMRPNIQAFEIDAISRKIITENGYPAFQHGLGHQLGRFVHDGTALMGPLWEKYADKPLQKLEPNMVFTIEPKVTVPNRGHVSIEEMAIVTENGCEWLTTPQKEIILIS